MAALTICPEKVVRSYARSSVQSPPGHSRARAVYERTRRRWRLSWSVMPDHALRVVRTLLDDTAGGALSFDLTPPGESAVRVRFVRPTLEIEHVSSVAKAVTADVEEVL